MWRTKPRLAELEGGAVAVGYGPMVVTGGIWLIAKLLRYAFPALFPTFQTELGVPNTVLGVAYAAMMLLYRIPFVRG